MIATNEYLVALDRDRHQHRVDVKAVTLHRSQLEKTNEGWTGYGNY